MPESKQDRRVKKTKKNLKQALARLLLEKDLKDVTIKDLTALADVNRGTFYLHYKDIYDLYEQLENEILNEFNKIIKRHIEKNHHGIPLLAVLDAVKFLSENAEICLAILRTNDNAFLSRLIEMNKPVDKSAWQALFGKEYEGYYEYCYSYITSGCVGLIHSWFMNGRNEPPEKIAQLAEKLMSASISSEAGKYFAS